MQKEVILYSHGEVTLEGFAAYASKERPLVVLCHAWQGKDRTMCQKAEEIASWGYVCFAVDMYGKGIIGKTPDECAALKKPFMEDRRLLLSRLMKGFEAATAFARTKVAIVGMGFGGVCALDLARSGADIQAAVSIYGHFDPPPTLPKRHIKAKILLLHGYNDPVSPMSDLLAFGNEMQEAEADWQAHVFGNTFHSFVNPTSNAPHLGILYNPESAERTWAILKQFLHDTLSK